MKKVLSLVAVAGMFAFASCESKKVEETHNTTEETTVTDDMGSDETISADTTGTTTTGTEGTTTTGTEGTTTTGTEGTTTTGTTTTGTTSGTTGTTTAQ